MAAHTRRLLASDPAATEWLNFTYVVGGAGDTPIQAIKLTGSRLLPRPPHDSVGPAEDTVIVTVYYPQGAARGRPSSSGLNFAYGGCPRALSYNPDTDLVHNDHPLHTATLHKADGAYDWHCHILLPPKRLWPFLELLLNRHCRDVSAAQRHLGQLRSTQVAPIAPSADEPSDSSGITGPLTYPDGSAVIFGACRDGEAFSRLSALERQWGPVGSRVSGSTEVQMIKEALEWLTVYNAVELLDKLAKRFTAPRLRELRFWKGNAIEHILVEAGATEGLAHGLRKHGLNANVVREADSCTPLHLACYPKKTAEAEAWFASRRPRLVAVLLGAGADPTLTNKWRESTSDNAVVKAALREQIRDGGAQPVSAPGPGSLRPAPPPLHSFRRQPTAPPSEASLRGGTLLAVPPLLASVAESSDRKRRGGDISGSPPRKSLRDEMKDTVHRAPRYVTAESSGDAPRVAVKPGEKTYVANVGYLSKPELARALGDRWREVTPGEGKDLGRVDLVVIDGAFWYDKSTQGLACGAKSRIYTSKTLLMKYEIHALLMASKSSYIPECILYDASHRPPRLPDGVWIWRPTVPHGGGHGVAIVTNQVDPGPCGLSDRIIVDAFRCVALTLHACIAATIRGRGAEDASVESEAGCSHALH